MKIKWKFLVTFDCAFCVCSWTSIFFLPQNIFVL
uniref:Uncharacterized protein n=1 Tax=Anguilla anguilla TaxID=7936 RepID=A0A0E9TFN1_ANGAN